MCLATVYKENDDSVIFKNVSRINVCLLYTSIVGKPNVGKSYLKRLHGLPPAAY